ncbi:MAG: aldo/keto reductase [Caldilineaceae bacterium]|nr:aldo/keto reductase [Caldilineaceae bacterium]MCY4090138.1 aldo/keto reductase [Caldilineaceae bacterium]MCY4118654.1 aldo/keto reductase [Caldilineaceae bacterium]
MLFSKIPGIDKPVSRLVQGTMWMKSSELDSAFAALDAFLAAGGNCFDTAHIYGLGDNERTVGQWIHSRGVRDEIVILGKGAHHSPDRKRVTPFDIQSDIHDSLARFKIDHIDLYLLHRDDPAQPVGPVVETLHAAREAGQIHAYGGSNWSAARLKEANEYAAAHGLTPFVVSSPQFSLAVQQVSPWIDCESLSGPEGEPARAWCRQNGVTLFVWSSLAGGFFSGRFRRDNLDTLTQPYDQLAVKVYCFEENFRRMDRAQELAESKGVTVPHIALAYVYNQPEGIHALSGARTPDEVRVNVEATEIELTAEETAYLELRD